MHIFYSWLDLSTLLSTVFTVTFVSSSNSGNDGSTSVKDPLGILEGIVSAVHASVEKG